jgi:hypothetical protein
MASAFRPALHSLSHHVSYFKPDALLVSKLARVACFPNREYEVPNFGAGSFAGASGADLANLLNEAAIMAVRRNGTQIELFGEECEREQP